MTTIEVWLVLGGVLVLPYYLAVLAFVLSKAAVFGCLVARHRFNQLYRKGEVDADEEEAGKASGPGRLRRQADA